MHISSLTEYKVMAAEAFQPALSRGAQCISKICMHAQELQTKHCDAIKGHKCNGFLNVSKYTHAGHSLVNVNVQLVVGDIGLLPCGTPYFNW